MSSLAMKRMKGQDYCSNNNKRRPLTIHFNLNSTQLTPKEANYSMIIQASIQKPIQHLLRHNQ